MLPWSLADAIDRLTVTATEDMRRLRSAFPWVVVRRIVLPKVEPARIFVGERSPCAAPRAAIEVRADVCEPNAVLALVATPNLEERCSVVALLQAVDKREASGVARATVEEAVCAIRASADTPSRGGALGGARATHAP